MHKVTHCHYWHYGVVPAGSSETIIPSIESDDNDEVIRNDAREEELADGDFLRECFSYCRENVVRGMIVCCRGHILPRHPLTLAFHSRQRLLL
jgi:hypothetical protein